MTGKEFRPMAALGGREAQSIFTTMLEDRIIFLNGEVDEVSAANIVAQLIYLEAQDPTKDISLYINSPGGSVTDGFAIYDTMQFIKCDVSTICVGMAASMGAFLLSSGTKGKRFSLPNSEIMIHQPLGGTGMTQASNVEIVAKHLARIKHKLTTLLADNCGQPYDKVLSDTDRDNFMSAQEAKEYGLVDKIFVTRE